MHVYRSSPLSKRASLFSCCRHRWLSTASNAKANKNEQDPNKDLDSSSLLPRAPQSFVKARFAPGEWDPERTNPLYRPRFTSNAKIISAEDFAARPKAGTSVEFESFADAMMTPSWLSSRDQEQIFQMYCDLMVSSAPTNESVTSHEYAIRVVAQRFRITARRVAGVIRLQHNEQQMRRAGIKLADDVADYMDNAIQQEINDAYASQNLRPPAQFVEDPVGITGSAQPSKFYTAVDDVVDVASLWPQTQKREDVQAQAFLDNYQYEIDLEPERVTAPMDADCKALLKRAKKLQKESVKHTLEQQDQTKKPARWKFMAQIVNTRELKKKKAHKTPTSYTNNNPTNTIVVDRDGTIRAATAAETASVDWKAARNVDKFIYGPVQQAWLQRLHEPGMTDVWGKVPPRPVAEEEEKGKEQEDNETEAATTAEATTQTQADTTSTTTTTTMQDQDEDTEDGTSSSSSSSDEEESTNKEQGEETHDDTEDKPKE